LDTLIFTPLKNNACFVIHFTYFLGKFDLHKCKFTKNKPVFLVCFLQEFKMNTISSSVDNKASKTTLICTL